MTIRIVTDRTCDLTPEIAEQYGIGIVPCYINVGEKSYLDGVDILRKDFYAQLPYFKPHPKTSAPGIGMYSAVYQRLANEGVDQIISLHIHSGLSNLSNAARLAAEAADKIKVTVVEAGQLTIGLGFLAIAAAQAARKGRSADEILKIIKEQDERTFVLFALDTLEYLRLSGRAPGLVVSIANLLRIKPIIQLHRGELRPVGTKTEDANIPKTGYLGIRSHTGPGGTCWSWFGRYSLCGSRIGIKRIAKNQLIEIIRKYETTKLRAILLNLFPDFPLKSW